MKNLAEELKSLGFCRVSVLDGGECGIAEKRLILCFIPYESATEYPEKPEAVIHPYYPVSQRAFRIIRQYVRKQQAAGFRIRQDTQIRIKPVLNRLPFLRRGRNTLSYLPEIGSRFHVQIMVSEEAIPVTDHLSALPHPVSCGECRRCVEACPGGAIREAAEGELSFVRERCLRWWMLNGQCPPDFVFSSNGNRLIGCDVCERVCPMNPAPDPRQTSETVPLEQLTDGENTDALADAIGSNYARKTRLQIQSCVIAASTRRRDLIPRLQEMAESDSEPLRQAAQKGLDVLHSYCFPPDNPV